MAKRRTYGVDVQLADGGAAQHVVIRTHTPQQARALARAVGRTAAGIFLARAFSAASLDSPETVTLLEVYRARRAGPVESVVPRRGGAARVVPMLPAAPAGPAHHIVEDGPHA